MLIIFKSHSGFCLKCNNKSLIILRCCLNNCKKYPKLYLQLGKLRQGYTTYVLSRGHNKLCQGLIPKVRRDWAVEGRVGDFKRQNGYFKDLHQLRQPFLLSKPLKCKLSPTFTVPLNLGEFGAIKGMLASFRYCLGHTFCTCELCYIWNRYNT